MRPSLSVTLEPGLEQGIPWGRDLYTFVTSAAGHMMRTLQKPRKNRPSKRQVNHRRFLHNMIQRKFADIEAANHRLASALYFKDEEKTLTSPQSQRQAAAFQSGPLPDPENCSVHIEADDISKSRSDASVDSQQIDVSKNNHPHSPHLPKQPPKSQPNCSTSEQVNQASERKEESGDHKLDEFPSVSSPEGTDVCHTEYHTDESPLKSINNFTDETLTALQNSSFIQFDQNMNMSPACSPELSPLSLDSCDFSIQMFTDISSCTQTQKSIIDIAESPWADIVDLFSIGNKDTGDSLDVGAFQSICACQDDVGQEVSAENQSYSVTQRMCSNTSQMEDLHYQSCEYRHGSQEDQESTLHEAAETQFNNFRFTQGLDITQNQFPMPISCHYNMSHLPTYQHPQQILHCIQVNCENNRYLTPFEGVAHSFSAPLPNPEYRPIATPPHENDWLFPDILKERTSPDCLECVFGTRIHCDTSL